MRVLISKSATSKALSIMIVIAVIAAAFGGYAIGSANQRTSYTTTQGTTSIFRSTSSCLLGTTVTTIGNSAVTTTTCVIQM